MFEITGDDIASLNDVDLRALIARLCEATLRRRGHSASAVTWGGNQTAADAGLDVRVELDRNAAIDGFIPRPDTGFQVKKTDMPASAITKEMKPGGKLRPVIRDLATRGGAYIMVSSMGSTSDSALMARRTAMWSAVRRIKGASALALDFYDRTRLASWVHDHPGLIPWVRARIGKSITGWQSYGAWAYSPDGIEDNYILDETARIWGDRKEDAGGAPVLAGIATLRDRLREEKTCVRLVGLSGVGKTRLVQALFDHRVGNSGLDPSLAFYTNVADDPDPQPIALASD
ncbi:MAG: hypothetical protein JO172_08715, partial [Hyphomicrobiales bacterium]|nr:hypothetical protein [Hyphomicrobiales bacterium]